MQANDQNNSIDPAFATCTNFDLSDYANYYDNLGSDNLTVCTVFASLLSAIPATRNVDLKQWSGKISLIYPPLLGRETDIDLSDR